MIIGRCVVKSSSSGMGVHLLVAIVLLCCLSYEVAASNDSCVGKPFGWKYQDITDCHGFFVCFMDQSYQAYCDFAEKFDDINKKCVPGKCPPCNCAGVPTVTPTPTPEHTPSPEPTETPEPSTEQTPASTPGQTPTQSPPLPDPSATPDPTPEQTPVPTPEQTPTQAPPTPEPSPEPTATPEPTLEPSSEQTPAPTPEQTPTQSPPTPESSPTPDPTSEPTPEQTPVPTPEQTPTQAPPTPEQSPQPTSVPTPGQSSTPAPIPTVTIPDGQVDPNIKECAYLPNGSFVRNPEHCRTYYVCRSGKAVKHRCTVNQWFDDIHFVCNLKQRVNCPIGKD